MQLKNQSKDKNILIIAGEDSGDLLGASIVKELKKLNTHLKFFGFGGQLLKAENVEILKTTEELAIIGIAEVIKNYRRLIRYMKDIVKECNMRNVKHAILVDYPGFNIKLAKLLKKHNITCYQVVSPTIWVWHYKRIFKIKRYYHSVLCLYDFEKEIYEKENVKAEFIGHPIVEKINISIANKKNHLDVLHSKFNNFKSEKSIALLPGSRNSEINKNMPFLIELAQVYHDYDKSINFYIAVSQENAKKISKNFQLSNYINIIEGDSHIVIQNCHSAVACSGTVTLEAALLKTPFVLIYKTSFISYQIFKRLLKLPFIGMVNILRKKFVTQEFIQKEMTIENVFIELKKIQEDNFYRKTMINEFNKINENLGNGDASLKAGNYLYKQIDIL